MPTPEKKRTLPLRPGEEADTGLALDAARATA